MNLPKTITTPLYVLLLSAPGIYAAEAGLVDPTSPLLQKWQEVSGSGLNATGLGQEILGLFSSYSLKSILIRDNERIAVVNDERLHIGDEIGRVRVAAIETRSVVLEGDGNVRVLTLHEQTIKTRIQANK